MKKLLALLLALTLIFTFAACGDGKGGGKDDDKGGSIGNVTSNTYETPVEVLEMIANQKEYYDLFDAYIKLLNGFCTEETEEFLEFVSQTKNYKAKIDENKENIEKEIEENIDKYGDDFKYTYTIIDKEEIDESDLEGWANSFSTLANRYDDIIDKFKEADEEKWEELADELEISTNQAKSLISIMESLRDRFEEVDVTEGYTLRVEISVDGSELDEPEIKEQEIVVVKANGRWIYPTATLLFSLIASLGGNA